MYANKKRFAVSTGNDMRYAKICLHIQTSKVQISVHFPLKEILYAVEYSCVWMYKKKKKTLCRLHVCFTEDWLFACVTTHRRQPVCFTNNPGQTAYLFHCSQKTVTTQQWLTVCLFNYLPKKDCLFVWLLSEVRQFHCHGPKPTSSIRWNTIAATVSSVRIYAKIMKGTCTQCSVISVSALNMSSLVLSFTKHAISIHILVIVETSTNYA